MSNTKRLLVYIVPVTMLALKIPEFIEVTITQNNGTNEKDPSQTWRDPTFIFWYTLSLIWHPTLTTGVLPFIGLVYMNMQIFIGIRQSRQVGDSFFSSRLIVPQNYLNAIIYKSCKTSSWARWNILFGFKGFYTGSYSANEIGKQTWE